MSSFCAGGLKNHNAENSRRLRKTNPSLAVVIVPQLSTSRRKAPKMVYRKPLHIPITGNGNPIQLPPVSRVIANEPKPEAVSTTDVNRAPGSLSPDEFLVFPSTVIVPALIESVTTTTLAVTTRTATMVNVVPAKSGRTCIVGNKKSSCNYLLIIWSDLGGYK